MTILYNDLPAGKDRSVDATDELRRGAERTA